MSVLTVAGTNIPDPTLSYSYPRSRPVPVSALPPHPAPSVPPGAFTRPDRKSYISATTTQVAPVRSISNHHHSRTISSNTLPPSSRNSTSSPSALPQNAAGHSRVPSSSHSRQSSASHNMSMHRQGTTASAASIPRRSTSGRSTATDSPTSYVALMRKQKATVWCDRAQNIDPRLASAQKAAKRRAALEVQGLSAAARTSTLSSSGVVGKIRHGGGPKVAPGYVPANMSAASVPVRLSANEMMGDEEESQSLGDNSMMHARTGSGRSSTNSAKYRSGYPRADQGRFSSTSTPPSEGSAGTGIPEDPETTTTQQPNKYDLTLDYDRRDSEDSFGDFKELSGPSAVEHALAQAKKAEDLRRRGSVDERTMSMGQPGVRLFVANPDSDPDD